MQCVRAFSNCSVYLKAQTCAPYSKVDVVTDSNSLILVFHELACDVESISNILPLAILAFVKELSHTSLYKPDLVKVILKKVLLEKVLFLFIKIGCLV